MRNRPLSITCESEGSDNENKKQSLNATSTTEQSPFLKTDTKRTTNPESLWENSESTVMKSRFNNNFVVNATLLSKSTKRTRNEAFAAYNVSNFSDQTDLIFD